MILWIVLVFVLITFAASVCFSVALLAKLSNLTHTKGEKGDPGDTGCRGEKGDQGTAAAGTPGVKGEGGNTPELHLLESNFFELVTHGSDSAST